MPCHLSFPAIFTFSNDKFSALKLLFSKMQPHYTEDATFKKFEKLIKDHELCVQLIWKSFHHWKCHGMEDRTVVAYGCRKTNKLKRGMEVENGVANGRLPSPLVRQSL